MKIFTRWLMSAGLVAIVCGPTATSAYTDFGQGKPVTFQDLAGKKFCWDTGRWVLYAANGQFLNSRSVHGTWVVVDRGVVEWRDEIQPGKYRSGRYGQWEVLPDGRLHSYSYCLLCGDHDHDHWATPCN
jgi:hypothetical protein